MELILRYKKILLLKSECRKGFKVTLIFSSYSSLVIDASIFANRHQIIYFLLSLEGNKYAGIKYPINLNHPEKLLLMRALTQKVQI